MNSQKADNQLNLALDIPEDIRQQSEELQTGFREETKSWELIVKHSGNLDRIRQELNVDITELFANFAIVVIEESLIPQFEQFEEIEFIEKPKMLNFQVRNGIQASCITQAQQPPYNLTGSGTIVAVIDTGIDYAHPDFRNPDGTSRILYLWDQSIQGNPPEGYSLGTLYTKEQIDEALKQPTTPQQLEIVPSTDLDGHGTHVAGICCGNGRARNGLYRGVAFESQIIVVKLGRSVGESFPSTSQLMEALDFVVRTSVRLNIPTAINISFGNTYGSHSGESLLEEFINAVSTIGRNNIVIGTGNEGATNRHYQSRLKEGETLRVEISVAEREQNLNLQLWRMPYDLFDVMLISPNGKRIGPFNRVLGTQQFVIEDTRVYLYYGEPNPYSIYQEMYFAWLPNDQFITSGIWTVEIIPRRIVSGEVYMWLPSGGLLNDNTKFLEPSVEITLTIPSAASEAITVGAYDDATDSLAFFSGRGYTINNQIKPEIVAPGVDIISASPGGSYSIKSGTSMATSFVTGSCALLMQWGIVNNNDRYMYGQKVKATLITTARPLKAFTTYPNETIGFGALCLRGIS